MLTIAHRTQFRWLSSDGELGGQLDLIPELVPGRFAIRYAIRRASTSMPNPSMDDPAFVRAQPIGASPQPSAVVIPVYREG